MRLDLILHKDDHDVDDGDVNYNDDDIDTMMMIIFFMIVMVKSSCQVVLIS